MMKGKKQKQRDRLGKLVCLVGFYSSFPCFDKLMDIVNMLFYLFLTDIPSFLF